MKLTPHQKTTLGKNVELGIILLSIIEERALNMQSTLAPLLKMDPDSVAFKDYVNNLAGYNQLLSVIQINLLWNGNPSSMKVH
ncbi:MAG: hypothetical protein KF802_08185 [Bdellovibrionaceae bacterium]|nr:hypothetical protein [Pseudobdellovibrionaceae bacterium]